MAFMAEHATRSPAASSPPPPPPFAQRFREVRALRGARALRALAAAPLLAYVRYDPVECGAACAELDGPWETAATFDVPGGVWHVACAEERQLCASRVADALGGKQPILEAWDGTRWLRYVGRRMPHIAVLMELMRLPEYLAARAVGSEHCAAWAAGGGCDTKRTYMQSSCAWACAERGPRGWAEVGEGEEALLEEEQAEEGAVALDGGAECEADETPVPPGTRPLLPARWWPLVQEKAAALGGERLDADGLAWRLPAFVSAAEARRSLPLADYHPIPLRLPLLTPLAPRPPPGVGAPAAVARPDGGEGGGPHALCRRSKRAAARVRPRARLRPAWLRAAQRRRAAPQRSNTGLLFAAPCSALLCCAPPPPRTAPLRLPLPLRWRRRLGLRAAGGVARAARPAQHPAP